MGGPVAAVIRKPSGEVIPMTFWTDMMVPYFLEPDVLRGDEAAIDKMIETWKDAGDAYAKSVSEGMNPDFLTDLIYSETPKVAPRDYGLVVLDLKSKTLFEMQDFTALGHFYHPRAIYGARFTEDRERGKQDVTQDAHMEAGWITGYELTMSDEMLPILEEAGFEPLGNVLSVRPEQRDQVFDIIDRHRQLNRFDAMNMLGLTKDTLGKTQKKQLENELRIARLMQECNAGKPEYCCIWAYANSSLGGVDVKSYQQGAEDAEEFLADLREVGIEIDGSAEVIWQEWIEQKRRDALDLDAMSDADAMMDLGT